MDLLQTGDLTLDKTMLDNQTIKLQQAVKTKAEYKIYDKDLFHLDNQNCTEDNNENIASE